MSSNELVDNISILIIEDESELREYLKEYLDIFFKKVYTANCGEEGYAKYLQIKPDIILTDINMPNLDGLSMIKRIREKDIDTQVIIISAHSEREKLLEAIGLGLVTYLVKPINTQKLKEILFDTVAKLKNKNKKIHLANNSFWDTPTSTLYHGKQHIALKEKETMLFRLLCSNPNHAFTAEDIFLHIYAQQEDKEYSEYSITSFIKRLRAKLPSNLIQNEYGLGYKVVLRG